MELSKILESKTKIRFQDCDPFNHLNNAAYFNYLINAREDQILDYYDLDIYNHSKERGKSWVVSSHQIAYFKPALLMENVLVESQLIAYDKKSLSVEIRMWNDSKSELKAVMWSSFVYVDLQRGNSEKHEEDLLCLFRKVLLPVEQRTFDERIQKFRQIKKAVRVS